MTITTYRPICEPLRLEVGQIVTRPPQLVEALDAMHANGGGALFYAWVSKPLLLLGLAGDGLRGADPIPVIVGSGLAVTPAGPVVRLSLTLFDDPAAPFLAEAWVNVADAWEREAFEKMITEGTLPVVACDERAIRRIISVSLRSGTLAFDAVSCEAFDASSAVSAGLAQSELRRRAHSEAPLLQRDKPTLRDVLEQAVASLQHIAPRQLDWSRARAQAERMLDPSNLSIPYGIAFLVLARGLRPKAGTPD